MVLLVALAGLAAGILLAAAALDDADQVTVTDTEVQLRNRSVTRRVPREQIHLVHLDGRDLVLRDAAAEELARERLQGGTERIRTVFEAHGYPWSPDGSVVG